LRNRFSKKQIDAAERLGRDAARSGAAGSAPYGRSECELGWAWIYGWEMEKHEQSKNQKMQEMKV
jgi:hypothetical protein